MIHQVQTKSPDAIEARILRFSPLSNHTQLGIVKFSKQLMFEIDLIKN